MKGIRYIDANEFPGGMYISENDEEIIGQAGTTIYSMSASANNDTYKLIAAEYGVEFIFEPNVPIINFYAVPRVDIFAVDGNDGYWGTVGACTNHENMNAWICYINEQQEVFKVADNLQEFLFPIETIGERRAKEMIRTNEVMLFCSREDAAKVIHFIDLPRIPFAEPKRNLGQGDGATLTSGKAIESKYKGGYTLSYGSSNYVKLKEKVY